MRAAIVGTISKTTIKGKGITQESKKSTPTKIFQKSSMLFKWDQR